MSGKSGENVTFCREIPDRDSGRVGETSICLSENKVTHVIACVVGADLSANSSLNYLDNHEYFAAKARSYGIALFLPIISSGSLRGVAWVNRNFLVTPLRSVIV